jgi:hypothetical protein
MQDVQRQHLIDFLFSELILLMTVKKMEGGEEVFSSP